MRVHNPAHPGLVLKEWMPEEMTVTEAALPLGITRVMLSKILNRKAGVSAEMALRLSKWLGTTPEMWAGIQSTCGLWETSRQRKSIKVKPLKLSRIVFRISVRTV